MSISTRHIRHDWPEWVDWNNQKTVKTMCGVRSRPHLCGIPGITQQIQVVEKNGREVWGWCNNCVVNTFLYYLPPALTTEVTSTVILDLHRAARKQLARQWRAHLVKREYALHARQAYGDAQAVGEDIRMLELNYPDLTAPS